MIFHSISNWFFALTFLKTWQGEGYEYRLLIPFLPICFEDFFCEFLLTGAGTIQFRIHIVLYILVMASYAKKILNLSNVDNIINFFLGRGFLVYIKSYERFAVSASWPAAIPEEAWLHGRAGERTNRKSAFVSRRDLYTAQCLLVQHVP